MSSFFSTMTFDIGYSIWYPRYAYARDALSEVLSESPVGHASLHVRNIERLFITKSPNSDLMLFSLHLHLLSVTLV